MSTLLKSWTWVEPGKIFDKTIELWSESVDIPRKMLIFTL